MNEHVSDVKFDETLDHHSDEALRKTPAQARASVSQVRKKGAVRALLWSYAACSSEGASSDGVSSGIGSRRTMRPPSVGTRSSCRVIPFASS